MIAAIFAFLLSMIPGVLFAFTSTDIGPVISISVIGAFIIYYLDKISKK